MGIYLSEYLVICAEAETSWGSFVDEEFYACSEADLWFHFWRLTRNRLLRFRTLGNTRCLRFRCLCHQSRLHVALNECRHNSTFCSSNFTYHSASQESKSLSYNKIRRCVSCKKRNRNPLCDIMSFWCPIAERHDFKLQPDTMVATKKLSLSQLWLSFPAAGTQWGSLKMNCKHCIFAAAMNLFAALPNGWF